MPGPDPTTPSAPPPGAPAAGGGAAGARGAVDRLRTRARDARRRAEGTLEAARERSGLVDAAVLAVERDRRSAGNVLAGAVAFRLFVYLLPLVLGVVTLAGLLHGLDDTAATTVGDRLGMGAYVLDSVRTAVEQSRRALWVLIPLSAWAIYTGGVGAAKVLRAVHAIAWGRPVERLRRGPAAAAATFGIAAGALVLVGGLHAVRHRSAALGTLVSVAGLGPLVLLWLLVSLLLPRDPRAGWRALVPGAVLVGAAVWAAQLVSVYYLAHRVQRASELYGSLGAAAAILAWLYLVARLMVASAMLNATLWERHARPPG